jgi:diguanylate cyclase (GGDEF)-like protein
MRIAAAPARPSVVLIASKQEWTSRSLESILAPNGYVVVRSYTVGRALERAEREQPDAIIIDVQLSDGTGHELCRELRVRQRVSPSTPILLTLPQPPTRRDRIAALHAGAWDCLWEPLDAEEVLAVLDAFVPAKLDADHARAEGLVDEATGLYNLRGLTRRAQELASHASRSHAALACVLLAPDLSLQEWHSESGDGQPATVHRIARALRAAGRSSDAIGRLGPSEFAIVAVDTDAEQAGGLADRLGRAILAAPDQPTEPASPLRLHAGCHGVADFHAASIDAVDLMLRATAALKKARSDPTGGWLRWFDD